MALKTEELQTLISLNSSQFHAELQKITSKLENLDRTTTKFNNNIGSTLTKSFVGAQLITNVLTKSLGFLNNTVTDSIKTTQNYENALIGLQTVAGRKLGQEAIPLATKAAKELAADGLMSVQDSALGLKNLLASGFSLPQAINLMNTFKDSAAFGRQSSLAFGQAISSATEGIKNGNSILVDNAGITKNLSMILTEAGYSQQDLMRATTDAGVRQALYNGLLKEGNLFQGDAARLANTTAGQLASLGVTMTNLKVTMGQFIKPVQSVVQSALLAFLGGVQNTLSGASNSIMNFSNRIAGYMLFIVRVVGMLLSRLPVIGKNFEGLANLSLRVSTAQNNLANSVGDTGDALDSTKKSTDALKKSLMGLAAFDEMNILSKPESGGSSPDANLISTSGGAGGPDVGIDAAAINSVADGVMKKFDDLKTRLKDTFEPILSNPVVKFFLELAKNVGLVALAFNILKPIVGLFLGFLSPLLGFLSPIKTVIVAIGSALGALSTPVLIVVAVIAALVAGFILLYQNSESFRNSIDQLVQGAFTWLQQNVVPIFEQIVAKVQEMIKVFEEKWPAIQAAIQPLIDSISVFLVGAFQLLGQIVDWLWKTILKPLVDFILANIVPAFSLAIDILTGVISIFSQVASTIIDMVMPVLKGLWDTFTTVFEAVRKIVEDVWNNILKPIFKALWDFISGFVIPIIQNLWNIFSKAFEGIKQIAENVWAGIMNAIKPVIDWIDKNIMPVINKIKDQFAGAFNGLKSTVEGIWNGISGAIKGGINGIIDQINGFIGQINNLIKGVSDAATSIPGGTPINFRVGYIQHLAKGGIVDSPTIAQIGESGREAVIPLENNTGWINELAAKIAGANSGSGNQMLVVKIGEKTIYESVIDYINDKTLATNKTILKI